jgi:predicted PurR-regulated permease PerM
VLGALLGAVILFADVVAPLFQPILLAAAMSILTSPILCEPLNRWLARRWPEMKPAVRHRISGIAATVALLAVGLAPILIALVSQADTLSDLIAKIKGVVLRDPATIQGIVDTVVAQIEQVNAHYQRLRLPAADIGAWVKRFLAESSDVNSAVVSLIFTGTGVVAQFVLSIVSLTYFNIDGPRIARALLGYAPLTDDQRQRLVQQHRCVVLRLLTDTVATAAVKGIVLGTIIWTVDRFLGSASLPWLPITVAASLITLLPLVGVTMVWLPFAGLAWSQHDYFSAILLAAACWSSNFYLDRWRERIGRRLHERTELLGFLLLLGVIGGVLSYGTEGLIIGPFAVVMIMTIGGAWLPLYLASPDAPRDSC